MSKSILSFDVDQDEGVPRVTPCVNGRSLAELVADFERIEGYDDPAGGYAGLIPSYFRYMPLFQHWLGNSGHESDGVYLLGCECGEVGCWPIVAEIEANNESVVWKRFSQPHRPQRDYSALVPFVFDRDQYEAALKQIEKVWFVD